MKIEYIIEVGLRGGNSTYFKRDTKEEAEELMNKILRVTKEWCRIDDTMIRTYDIGIIRIREAERYEGDEDVCCVECAPEPEPLSIEDLNEPVISEPAMADTEPADADTEPAVTEPAPEEVTE